ncbi:MULTISPECIES: flagellar hook-length control protein FliK [Methylotenera]|uniref:flagellar hook-length control protein FliK n=1 Tax=Methylotenera TaxID=359407 RepID=UPI00035F3AD3|nr:MULTISPECIES: flagellar hook-length control protein FliK [Methylotenera]
MYKPLSSDVKAIDRVSAIKPLGLLDDHRRNSRLELPQLVKGHIYSAKIIDVAVNGGLKVSVEGRQLVLNMQQHWKIGETLTLRYMGDETGISFQLLPHVAENTAQVILSPTAKQVAEQINLANREGAANIYQAMIPATNKPEQVKQFAADLQHTMEVTGLFYESHLADFTQGIRTLSSLMQEPQNQGGLILHHLMAQQLNVLETQRLVWHGEIWPGQLADWQVEVENQSQAGSDISQETTVSSHLNLQLPHLGNITAKIRLAGDKLTVALVADEQATTDTLKINSRALIQSLEQHTGRLEAISIAQGNRGE